MCVVLIVQQNYSMYKERKLILYISMSLDGFIADNDGNLDFLSMVAHEGEDYGYSDFVSTVDAVIIGRKTYEKVLSMGFEYPHTDKDVYIITRSEKPAIGSFKFFSGDLTTLVADLKRTPGKHIYCDGGAEIVNVLLKKDLIDELVISVIPILLGDGVKLFKGGRPPQKLDLISIKKFEKGLVQMHYRC